MQLPQKNNASKKMSDLVLVFITSFSLLGSLAKPVVAKAEIISTIQFEQDPFLIDTLEPTVLRPAKKTKIVIATAYSSEVAQTDSTPCVPAMSNFDLCDYFAKNGVEDTIAANFLPLGTEIRFPDLYGDRVFVVRDRMNSKYNGKSRIDFWKKDRLSAVNFGVQRIKMEIL